MLKTAIYGSCASRSTAARRAWWWGAIILVFGLPRRTRVLYTVQHDLKRLWRTSVENIGIILIGIGLSMSSTFTCRCPGRAAAGLYHTLATPSSRGCFSCARARCCTHRRAEHGGWAD
jgi:formate hydrogenlyase subunit 3/multisubunit Na+/H+ antiporter MnhD subunit